MSAKGKYKPYKRIKFLIFFLLLVYCLVFFIFIQFFCETLVFSCNVKKVTVCVKLKYANLMSNFLLRKKMFSLYLQKSKSKHTHNSSFICFFYCKNLHKMNDFGFKQLCAFFQDLQVMGFGSSFQNCSLFKIRVANDTNNYHGQ